MKKARRFSPEQRYSFILNISKAQSKPYKFSFTLHQMQVALGIFMALSIFSAGSTVVYHQMQPVMDKYREVISFNNEQKRQIFALLEKNKTMQDSSHQLLNEDNFLRKKLSLGEKNKIQGKQNPVPVIAVNHKTDIHGEIAEIIIDDKVILSLFDNSAAPTVRERAMEIADNIREVYSHQSPYHRFTFQGDRDNNYQVYYKGTKVFEVGEMEASYFRLSPRQLTKKWIEDLSIALSMKTEPLFVLQVRNILNSFHNSKKLEPVYTDIDYVSGKKIVSEYTTEPEIHKIDQLVAFMQNELKKRTESYNSLRNVIKEYKIRFAKTPSIMPIFSHSISGFGRRIHPITGKIRFHAGVDLPAPEGTPVRATAEGVVVRIGWFGGYGKAVEIQHGYGLSTLYAHNSVLAVNVGDTIRKGQIISYCGRTGWAIGSHVHYEVRLWGRPINPNKYLNLDIFTASRNW